MGADITETGAADGPFVGRHNEFATLLGDPPTVLRGLRTLVQWLVIGAVIGAALNSKDIQRYLKIRGM